MIAGGGISNHFQVTKVGEGIAYVNSTGVQYFDGNAIQNLSDNTIDSKGFSTDSRIVYEPHDKLIMVWPTGSAAEAYCYSLKSKSWVSRQTKLESGGTLYPETNSTMYAGDTYVYVTNGSSHTLKKIQDKASGTYVVSLKTGKISCGDMAMEKKFKKVYVTLSTSATTVNCAWDIDSGTFAGNTNMTLNGINEVVIDEKGKSIELTLTDTSAPLDLEISDIQIIYQDRRVK